MKGVIPASGATAQMHAVMLAVCMQLLPVYNKPKIHVAQGSMP